MHLSKGTALISINSTNFFLIKFVNTGILSYYNFYFVLTSFSIF